MSPKKTRGRTIGRSLAERHELLPLPAERAEAMRESALAAHAAPLVAVRARGAAMIAILVVGADRLAVRLCKSAGLEMAPGGSGVFGLPGAAIAELLPRLTDAQHAWLSAPCGARETKVLLVAGGFALLALDTVDGKVTIRAGP